MGYEERDVFGRGTGRGDPVRPRPHVLRVERPLAGIEYEYNGAMALWDLVRGTCVGRFVGEHPMHDFSRSTKH